MKSIPVTYFDGRVSACRAARITLEGERLIVSGEGFELSYALSELTIPPGVGAVRRTIRLPDGGVCELEQGRLPAELERGVHSTAWRLLHRWERSLPLALAALLLTTLVVLAFVRYGVPLLAKRVALALPVATERAIGSESLATLDRLLMKPSSLPAERRSQLTELFRRVAGRTEATAGCRLEFRSSPAIGANAFALPSGIVVVTDDLVDLARSDDEIAAIMAHELGHVRGRHIMRHLLQSSVSGLIIASLTGDLTSITSLAATLPTVLVDASFSREFEREADDAALAWMKAAGVPPRRYAEVLGRLQAQLDAKNGTGFDKKHPARNYLSSHPDTGERIRRIMKEER